MRTISVLLGLLLPVASMGVHAAEPPAIPEHADPKRYEEVPEPWRDYLLQARAAERISDPLQRCLAFPDIPGNHWPAGHAAAHCRFHLAYKPLSLAEIAAMLDNGDVAKLEGLMEASLQRHFNEEDFSEEIHNAFDVFSASPEADKVSAEWLKLAPHSAYANFARGAFLASSAWKARGGKYASETPRSSLQRMSELVEGAIPYLEKSLEINPRLMPAYTVLLNIGMADSREGVESNAIERAEKIDPACLELARMRMSALQPRWGGSYEQMLAYANELKQYLPRRPQLAIHVAAPFADRGDRLTADDELTKETLDVLEAAIAIGSNEEALNDAANVAFNTTDAKPDHWKGLAYLLQKSRFQENSAWADRWIAWMLVRMEPEWSLRNALKATALDPDNAWGHYLAGAGYNTIRQYAEADREYAIAIKDPNQRQGSLREVAEMWLFSGFQEDAATRKAGALRAKPYIAQLLREYPDDGRGRMMRFFEKIAVDNYVEQADIRATLEQADRSDPWQVNKAKGLETMLEQIDASKKPKH